MNPDPQILDMTCGGRMMWADKTDPRILALDCRRETHTLCDGRTYQVAPDIVGDFRNMAIPTASFNLVLFDPPHLKNAGENSWLRKKYGVLDRNTWRDDIRRGFEQAWRVLRIGGTLIFKWNTDQIPLRELEPLYPDKPVFKTGTNKTYIITFYKQA